PTPRRCPPSLPAALPISSATPCIVSAPVPAVRWCPTLSPAPRAARKDCGSVPARLGSPQSFESSVAFVDDEVAVPVPAFVVHDPDRKSTRLNSSHVKNSY